MSWTPETKSGPFLHGKHGDQNGPKRMGHVPGSICMRYTGYGTAALQHSVIRQGRGSNNVLLKIIIKKFSCACRAICLAIQKQPTSSQPHLLIYIPPTTHHTICIALLTVTTAALMVDAHDVLNFTLLTGPQVLCVGVPNSLPLYVANHVTACTVHFQVHLEHETVCWYKVNLSHHMHAEVKTQCQGSQLYNHIKLGYSVMPIFAN